MKLKKVEISAFRIFDKPEDATFDFTNQSGDIANFISLYAPNGFGKTSFYDAVEWGITNNVNRFWQNKNTVESINILRELTQKQVKLIHRTGSNEDTFVKITTDIKELAPRQLKVHGRSKADLAKNNKIENKGFQQVLLSQEWVAAFLQEVDGVLRYKKFIENPFLQEVDNYYKGIKALDGFCCKTIKTLQADIEDKKQSVQDNSNSNLLETINSQISKIVEKYGGHNLKTITLSTTKEQIKDLRDLISDQIITYNTESAVNGIISSITTAYFGDGNIVSANVFYKNRHLSENTGKELAKNIIIIDKFDKLEKLSNKLKNNQVTRKQIADENEQIDKVISQFTQYKQIRNIIDQKSESETNMELGLAVLNTQAEDLAKEEIKQKNHRDTFIKQIEDIKEKTSKLPELKQRTETLNNDIQKAALLLTKKKPEEVTVKNKLKDLDESVSEFNVVIDGIKKGKYPFLSSGEYPGLSNIIKKLEENNIESQNLKSKLNEWSLKIEQQQSLNSSIEVFIKTGLSIVNERQNASCPLCEHTYESHNQLAQRIANNNALNNILQDLLKEKNILILGIAKLDDEITKGHEMLKGFYRKKIDDLLASRQGLKRTIDNLRKAISSQEDNLLKLKESLQECNIQLIGLSAEEYEKNLVLSTQEAVKSRDNSAKSLTEITSNLTSINDKMKTQNSQINLIKKDIQKLMSNEKYSYVVAWFKDNYPNDLISENILSSRKTLLEDKIKPISKEIIVLEKKIATIENDLSIYTKEGALAQRKQLQARKHVVDGKTDSYIHFLRDKLNIDPGDFDREKLLVILDEKGKEHKAKLKIIRELREEYQKLEKYSENLLPFLQSENARLEMKEKENELKFLNEKVTPLIEKEKERTKSYLEDKVRHFFYEDLINDLYRKIDPHPEFKRVEFKANFDTDNPRLDVIVTNLKNDKRLIPNLYFSTSQINILSLCIFLASALNSKEYDCIFIDDPIQSLDSINVLSTIDLLRSIVVNEDKQIILSTHDENFHNLLKKKIPDSLFKSKFLELETFGKVKRETT